MGTLDAIRAGYGKSFDEIGGREASRHNWQEVCVCGHTGRYHAESIGGSYSTAVHEGTREFRGRSFRMVAEFGGCVGAVHVYGRETETRRVDDETGVMTTVIQPTCPCTDFRPVARVDRPNRMFCQRVNDRHPFLTGVRALATHLSRRKAADPDRGGDPVWADAEFDRRFTWIPEAQRCSISSCKATGDDVLPAYVNGDRDSAMRCARHRS
jgi:hypothetical protein